jgi:hypothetical protein
MKSFHAQVNDWKDKNEKLLLAVFREIAKRVGQDVRKTRYEGVNMRVDTGFLRASFQASLTAMPAIDDAKRPDKGRRYTISNQIELVLLSADLNNTIYMGFTASYARHREYKDGFVRLAAQNWNGIVNRVVMELKARAK